MSEYSYSAVPGYGASYGTRDQPNPPYLAPTYHNQYLQPDDSAAGHANAASSFDAYEYNRTMPGYNAGAPPLPIYQGWNQDPVPLPPYNAAYNTPQYPGYTENAQSSTQYSVPAAQPSYPQHTPAHLARPFEQRELSEGEFDDGTAATDTPPAPYGASHYQGHDNTGYVDTEQRALLPRTREYPLEEPSHHGAGPSSQLKPRIAGAGLDNNYSKVSHNTSQGKHQQSNAYSPYTSTREENIEQPKANQSAKPYAPARHSESFNGSSSQNQRAWGENNNPNGLNSTTQSNGYHTTKTGEAKSQLTHDPASTSTPSQPPSTMPMQSQLAPGLKGRTVLEMRKKAEGAILNLWPYDVRYQTYVDEGFKEDILGNLFDELRMPRNSPKPNINFQTAPERKPDSNISRRQNVVASGVNISQPLFSRNEQRSHPYASVNGEATNGSSQPQNPPDTNAAGNTVQATQASLNEKEKTLQAKMEALRKSREERAQKAASRNKAKASTSAPPVAAATPAAPVAPITHIVPTPVAPVATLEPQLNVSTSEAKPKPSASPSKSPVSDPRVQTPGLPISSNSPAPQITGIEKRPPSIPGLFLASASSPAPPSTTNTTMNPPVHINQRKRPVAADFDEPIPLVATFKRPFGQSRNDQPLVIDVSEDEGESEDEDVEMDLESQADQDSPIQTARLLPEQRSSAIASLPPLSNFPTRTTFASTNSSAANTPPSSQTPSKPSAGRPEVLLRKESEIEQLKKRIAEAEARKKKLRQSSSGIKTPRISDSPSAGGPVTNAVDSNPASNVEASIVVQRLLGIADKQVISDKQRLADAQVEESEKVAKVKRIEAERIRLRRAKIAADLPLVESEFQQNQAKLDQMRAEMARIEEAVRKNMNEKQRLAEEMERLGQETEADLQAQREKLDHLTKDETNGINVPSRPAALAVQDEESPDSAPPKEIGNLLPPKPIEPNSQTTTITEENTPEEQQDAMATPGEEHSQSIADKVRSRNSSVAPQPVVVDATDRVSADHALEEALQEAVRADADSQSHEDIISADMEVSYAPDPDQLAPESQSSHEEDMADISSSPDVQRQTPIVGEHEPVESDPPEATPPLDVASSQAPIKSPPIGPLPPQTDPKLDNHSFDNNITQGHELTVHNDAQELSSVRKESVRQLIQKAEERSSFFTPYASPLKQFRAYRFHPDLKQEVHGGLRSLTYSHKIKPEIEFCRYELAGGICNDSTCEFQHFKDIGIADDAILTSLGSPEEFKAGRREEFCAGLRKVLVDMRMRKIRDFEIIAGEILAYRAQFLNDKSKILPLEGTSI